MNGFKMSLVLLIISCRLDAQVQLINRAISENDHKRKLPLTEALNAGFAGVATELKLNRDGKLVSGKHLFKETYLQPLHERIGKNSGSVYPGKKIDFILYLQIGSDSIAIYKTLRKVLDEYIPDLGIYQGTEKKGGPLLIVLTGHVPHAIIAQEEKPTVMVDELTPSERNSPQVFISRLDFGDNYSWNGDKNMPNMQYHSFVTRVKLAKKAGRKVMASNYPDSANAMEIILGAGVDYFLVDDIPAFVKFWTSRKPY